MPWQAKCAKYLAKCTYTLIFLSDLTNTQQYAVVCANNLCIDCSMLLKPSSIELGGNGIINNLSFSLSSRSHHCPSDERGMVHQ